MRLPVTRRGFLAMALAAVTSAAGTRLHRMRYGFPAAGARELASPVAGLTDLFSDLAAAVAVGEAYLRGCSGSDILPQLLSGAGIDPRARVLRIKDFHERRRRDFLAGDTLLMDGWLMARSEVCACALLAYGRQARSG